jgi:hypothetical protein
MSKLELAQLKHLRQTMTPKKEIQTQKDRISYQRVA